MFWGRSGALWERHWKLLGSFGGHHGLLLGPFGGHVEASKANRKRNGDNAEHVDSHHVSELVRLPGELFG
eukprot:8791092-Pyramimonas_sp.AAC.1